MMKYYHYIHDEIDIYPMSVSAGYRLTFQKYLEMSKKINSSIKLGESIF